MRHVNETLLPWKSNKYYIFLCVHPYVSVVMRARVRACAHVALLIQHARRMRHSVCGPSASTIFFRHFITGTIFVKKKLRKSEMHTKLLSETLKERDHSVTQNVTLWTR
jgi:hypothetical protein